MIWLCLRLMASGEKREALKVELDQLKGNPGGRKEGPAAPQPMASKGCITLQELRLPLKADFVCSTANKPGTRSITLQFSMFSIRPHLKWVLLLNCYLSVLRIFSQSEIPQFHTNVVMLFVSIISESTKHSFFIMIRAGAENIVATPLATTHRGLSGDTLTFPTKFTMWVRSS